MSTPSRFELKFDWNKHFVYSQDGTKCVGACALMVAKYWGIDLPDDRCQAILTAISVPAFEGPDAKQVMKTIEQIAEVATITEAGLVTTLDQYAERADSAAPEKMAFRQDLFHARNIEWLKAAVKVRPPIPLIVVYDDIMASFHEESPGGHASVVHSLDFGTRFIYLVDPNAQTRRSPTYYTFDDFGRGWKSFDQTTILLYPAHLYRIVKSVTSTTELS